MPRPEPRPRKGLIRRGSSFYTRVRDGGKRRWVNLGSDLEKANALADALRSDEKRRRLEATLRELDGRDRVLVDQRTVADAAHQWLEEDVARRRPSDKARRLARNRVEHCLIPFMGVMLLRHVRRQDMNRYALWVRDEAKNMRTNKPYSPQSVRHILSDARRMMYWCADSELIEHAPVPGDLLPRVQEKIPDPHTADEIAALTSMGRDCDGNDLGFVARFLVSTGLRWGEACRAKKKDVHGEVLLVQNTKTKRVKSIPLPPELLEEIKGKRDPLVPFGAGDPSLFMRRARKASGVEEFMPKRMRDTFACRFLWDGGRIEALQPIMGHSTRKLTERYGMLFDPHILEESRKVWLARAAGPKLVALDRAKAS